MTTTPQTNRTLQEIAQEMRGYNDFVICGHTSPDGDCLGSQLALMHALRAMGKRAHCVYATEATADLGLRFLPGLDDVICARDFHGACGAFVSVDVQIKKRIGDAMCVATHAPVRISIDHHAEDECYADLNYVDPDAAATCILIWELIGLLGATPTPDMATCCYTGLMTDTGRFQFQNTDSVCFAAAGEMIAAGADPAVIAAHVYQSRRLESLLLEEVTIRHAEFDAERGLAMSYLSAEDFASTGAIPDDTETLVDTLRSVEFVRVACMLREQDGTVRGSLRAKDATDVSVVARNFGGGGHRAAAGFTVENARIADCAEDVRTQLLAALAAHDETVR